MPNRFRPPYTCFHDNIEFDYNIGNIKLLSSISWGNGLRFLKNKGGFGEYVVDVKWINDLKIYPEPIKNIVDDPDIFRDMIGYLKSKTYLDTGLFNYLKQLPFVIYIPDLSNKYVLLNGDEYDTKAFRVISCVGSALDRLYHKKDISNTYKNIRLQELLVSDSGAIYYPFEDFYEYAFKIKCVLPDNSLEIKKTIDMLCNNVK